MYAPCDAKITKVNTVLEEEPQQISIGAESEGWLIELEFTNADQLDEMLDEKAYNAYVEKLQAEEDWSKWKWDKNYLMN